MGSVGRACGTRITLGAFLCAAAAPAQAHVSQDAFVLLLPTGIYTIAGVAAVTLTVLILAAVPARWASWFFSARAWPATVPGWVATACSLVSTLVLAFLLYVGFTGPHDPAENLLPLAIWTVWWIALVLIQAVFGDLWQFINPWTGLYRLACGDKDMPPLLRLPAWAGSAPGIAAFLVFSCFALADPAPDDAERLAIAAGFYWLYTFAAMIVFGAREWLARGECFTMLFNHYASISAIKLKEHTVAIGVPGWQTIHAPALTLSAASFIVMLLATGSFDGLNETFWWLAQIGVNPLEFPGRSALIWQTVAGLLGANLVLVTVFAATVYLGLALIGERARLSEAVGRLARSILPIAIAYHAAHYLVALLINGQYALAAFNDPLSNGADLLGLAHLQVTTGFLNARDTVRVLWLGQAGLIVAGHMLAVLTAHAIALDMFPSPRKAFISQIPLATFMVLYTLFGLWLLASPRGA